MNQTKRLKNNCSDQCEDYKRWKFHAYRTLFEDLSNEIIYDIFEYLHSHHAYESFYNLNKRFQNLFIHSDLPILVNIASISRQTFASYIKDIIEPHANRIQSIRFRNSFPIAMSQYLFPMMKNFTQLKALVIHDIASECIDALIDSLFCLPSLTTLDITCVDKTEQTNKFYQKIFRLPALKYFQTNIEIRPYHELLATDPKEVSSIEYLVINNQITIDVLDSLFSHLPKLRHLSLNNLTGNRQCRIQTPSSTSIYLNSASLRMNLIEFHDFEWLIIDYFSQISRLSITYQYTSFDVPQYLDADRWERLISSHMPNLRIFDFQHELTPSFTNIYLETFEARIREFNSTFWTTHQWFFEHCYYHRRWWESAFFFSTNPYRRPRYILGNSSSDRIHSNMSSVKQLSIHSTHAIRTFSGYFPNVRELCLLSEFNLKRKSLITDLNRILPLRYLNELVLNCHRFPFEQVLELLSCTPNVHTLKLDGVLLYGTKANSVQKMDLFRSVCSTNTVSHLTVNQRITLEKAQLITALFARLECLTINLANYDLQPIVRFLLAKSVQMKHRLSSLRFTKRSLAFYQDLERFISLEKLLNDYTLKFKNENVSLWW